MIYLFDDEQPADFAKYRKHLFKNISDFKDLFDGVVGQQQLFNELEKQRLFVKNRLLKNMNRKIDLTLINELCGQ